LLLLVGLGNPGSDYARHRHNVGFMAADEIARRHGFAPFRARFQGQVAEGRLAGDKAMILKPQTYMNASGQSVGEAVRFYKLAPADVVVLHDELDLPPGRVKVKRGGGHGGHNGLRDIDAHLGQDYWRVRIGIGHPGHKDRVSGYVLHDFSKTEQVWLDPLIDAIAAQIELLAQPGGDAKFATKIALLTQPEKPKKPKAEKPAEG